MVQTLGGVASKMSIQKLDEGTGAEVNKGISEMQSLSYEAMLIAGDQVSKLIERSVTDVLMIWKSIIDTSAQGGQVSSTVSTLAGSHQKELMKAMSEELRTAREAE
jgi:hypothetical protein